MSTGGERPTIRTEEHGGPEPPAKPAGRDVLLVAFPRPAILEMPKSNEPAGRAWLEAAGITDAQVSTEHFVLARRGALQIKDLGSRNGTWINGRRIEPNQYVTLEDRSIVRMGQTIFVARQDWCGGDAPSAPMGGLVGPFGLEDVRSAVAELRDIGAPNVLIEGETGTGKELLARYVAETFGRADPYQAVNVAGVPSGVFDAQLFGYVKGAYSGSADGSEGLLAACAKGALFLDEIGELALDLQPKLLRALENRTVLRVGATRATPIDVLLIAATNRALDEMVELGTFRRDLLARFGSARLRLPTLSERPEDVFAIATELYRRRGVRLDLRSVEVEAVERLMMCSFRSNIRELAATLDAILREERPPSLKLRSVDKVIGAAPSSARPAVDVAAAEEALARAGGNQSKAARDLGIDRAKLLRLLKRGSKPPPEVD